MKKKLLFFAIFLLLIYIPSEAVKLVTWNLMSFPGSPAAARDRCFRLVVNKIAPDVLVCQDMIDLDGSNQFLSKVMNYTTPGKYAAAPFYDSDDTDNALFYRKAIITYLGKTEIKTPFRYITEYRLKVKAGAGAGATFHIYSMHLKAGSGQLEREARAKETQILRDRLNSLPGSTLALACGTLNLLTNNEMAYQYLINHDAPYSAQLNDPVQKPGHWHDRPKYALFHTQSARIIPFYGGATEGLNDRFDFILISDSILASHKLTYHKGSYEVYGNDGKHFNKGVNTGTNFAVKKTQADALWSVSDHLPVMIDLLPPSGKTSKELPRTAARNTN